MVGIVAFGWVHFKQCCADNGLNWRECRHVVKPEHLAGVGHVILHHTANDPRLAHVVTAVIKQGA